jgi:nicotinic acid mononucleotide adenylyltransferase
LSNPARITSFDLVAPAASRDVRARLEAGEDVRDVIPDAVWGMIERDGLYRRHPSYTESA